MDGPSLETFRAGPRNLWSWGETGFTGVATSKDVSNAISMGKLLSCHNPVIKTCSLGLKFPLFDHKSSFKALSCLPVVKGQPGHPSVISVFLSGIFQI